MLSWFFDILLFLGEAVLTFFIMIPVTIWGALVLLGPYFLGFCLLGVLLAGLYFAGAIGNLVFKEFISNPIRYIVEGFNPKIRKYRKEKREIRREEVKRKREDAEKKRKELKKSEKLSKLRTKKYTDKAIVKHAIMEDYEFFLPENGFYEFGPNDRTRCLIEKTRKKSELTGEELSLVEAGYSYEGGLFGGEKYWVKFLELYCMRILDPKNLTKMHRDEKIPSAILLMPDDNFFKKKVQELWKKRFLETNWTRFHVQMVKPEEWENHPARIKYEMSKKKIRQKESDIPRTYSSGGRMIRRKDEDNVREYPKRKY